MASKAATSLPGSQPSVSDEAPVVTAASPQASLPPAQTAVAEGESAAAPLAASAAPLSIAQPTAPIAAAPAAPAAAATPVAEANAIVVPAVTAGGPLGTIDGSPSASVASPTAVADPLDVPRVSAEATTSGLSSTARRRSSRMTTTPGLTRWMPLRRLLGHRRPAGRRAALSGVLHIRDPTCYGRLLRSRLRDAQAEQEATEETEEMRLGSLRFLLLAGDAPLPT